jgi:hypothetical protein
MSREIMQKVLCIIKLLRTHDNEQATEKLELISAFEQELAKLEQESRKEWVGLTDDESMAIANWQLADNRPLRLVIEAIEAKLKDKNTT